MESIVAIVAQGLVLWVAIVGLAYMIRGPRGAGAVLRWPVVTAFRILRRVVGGFFVALGHWIRG